MAPITASQFARVVKELLDVGSNPTLAIIRALAGNRTQDHRVPSPSRLPVGLQARAGAGILRREARGRGKGGGVKNAKSGGISASRTQIPPKSAKSWRGSTT